jgi:hypothetical protein
MDRNQLRFTTSRPTSYGAWLAASVLALISFAIFWAAGPRQTKSDLAACRVGYTNARTAADSLLVDSMHVLTAIPKRGTLFHPDARCAAFRSSLAR